VITEVLILGVSFAPFELSTFGDPFSYARLVIGLGAAAAGLWAFNRHRAKSAVLYFEELPDEVITTLGLISAPPARSE